LRHDWSRHPAHAESSCLRHATRGLDQRRMTGGSHPMSTDIQELQTPRPNKDPRTIGPATPDELEKTLAGVSYITSLD